MLSDSKLVLITGASRGIGRACAESAASAGYAVAVTYTERAGAADEVVTRIRSAGGKAKAFKADISVESDVLALFSALDDEPEPLTGLINNAAILDQQTRLDGMSASRMARIFEVNILGTFLCTREAVRRMSTTHGGQGGAIVNISSMASRLGSPNEYIDYAASKGAVDTLTIGLSKEVAAEGIRVNGVRPGLIYTDMHASSGEAGRVDRLKSSVPMQRGGQAHEVAAAALWLLSEEASYVTGTFIDTAGGR